VFRRDRAVGVTMMAVLLAVQTPRLTGAACRGQAELFDAANRHDPRIAGARAICASCPVLGACRAWLVGLPVGLRPCGVVAGRYCPPPRSPAPVGYSVRVCVECGRGFAAKRGDARFCSAVCRMNASRARRLAVAPAAITQVSLAPKGHRTVPSLTSRQYRIMNQCCDMERDRYRMRGNAPSRL
jgi:hypothetical protein